MAAYNPYGYQNPYGYNWMTPSQTPTYPNYYNGNSSTYQPYAVPQQNTFSVPNTQPQPQGKQPINWVKNQKEVEEAYVEPNSAGVFWNENEPVIYLKKVDATGKADITIYDLVERKSTESAKTVTTDTPSKDEFTQLEGVVNSLLKEIDAIKSDMYGIAGKKKIAAKKVEAEEDA